MKIYTLAAITLLFCSSSFCDFTLFVGSYTEPNELAHDITSERVGEGITTVGMDDEGNLTKISVQKLLNPAVLQMHPNKKLLYALSESIHTKSNAIVAFKILENGKLFRRSSWPSSGKSICYMSINEASDLAIFTNYWDGMIQVANLDAKGRISQNFSFLQTGRKNFRQVEDKYDHWENRYDGPHPHSAHIRGQRVFVPDLGENAIFQYKITDDPDVPLFREAVIPLAPYSGPRHIVIHPRLPVAYVSNELASTVTMGSFNDDNSEKCMARFRPEQYISTLPTIFTDKNYVSELSLSPDGRFLYVSNRGHDSIAHFRIDQTSGRLALIDIVSSEGQYPRHFALSNDQDARFLVAANQNSHSLKVFYRDIESGALVYSGKDLSIGLPNFVRFY